MTIREARISANLTQRQLSDLFNIPIRTIECWESGSRRPPAYVETLLVEKLQTLSKTDK